MRHQLFFSLAFAASLAACYVAPDPDGFSGDSIARLEIMDAQPIPADGQSRVHLALHIDPNTATDTAITVETSSGVLSVSADPAAPEARKISPKSVGTGLIALTLRVSNTPGAALITANVGGYVTQIEVSLSLSSPTSVVLSSPKESLPADGESKFVITALLLAKAPPARVSLGTRVRFAACCVDSGSAPVPCSSADLLTIPAEAELVSGQAIEVQAITERILSTIGGPESITAFIVAEAVSDEDAVGSLCDSPRAGAVRDKLSLAVRPIKP